MQVQKTEKVADYNELTFVGDNVFNKGVDVTSIVERKGSDFISLMGKAGGKEFHNYFGLKDGKWIRFTGVTSVLEYVGDKSNLMQWYANQVVEQFGWSKQLPIENTVQYNERLNKEIGVKFQELISEPFEEVVDFIKKARTAASTYTRRTANLGKAVHLEIETYIKTCIRENKGAAMRTISNNEQVQHFIDWAIKNNVIFKASELKVYSKTHWIAGTCDIVLEINGDLYIGDIKTTNSIYGRSYFAQCSAYRMCLEEMFPNRFNFAGSILVRIGRDGLFDPEEDVHFSPYYEDDKKYFLCGLEVYRQEKNMYGR